MAVQEATLPFFSIIIPTYNRARYLSKALNSILAQEFKHYEIIIVDDGSTDNTKKILEDIITGNRCIKYFFKENEERSIARNYGIIQASGKYICFLDSDDIIYPNHMSVAYELLKKNNFPEVCLLGYEKINPEGDVLFQIKDFDDRLDEKIIKDNMINCNGIFIKKEIALQFPFIHSKDAIISEDWYVWLRLASRFKIHTNNVVTSAILEHDSRSLNNINVDKLLNCTELIVNSLKADEVFLQRYKRKAKTFFSNQYSFVMLLLSLNERRKEYIVYMVKSLKEDLWVFTRKRFLASLKYYLFPFLIKRKV